MTAFQGIFRVRAPGGAGAGPQDTRRGLRRSKPPISFNSPLMAESRSIAVINQRLLKMWDSNERNYRNAAPGYKQISATYLCRF